MKSYDTTSDHDSRSRAATNDLQQKAGVEKGGLASPGPIAQRKHREMIDNSPYMTDKKKRVAEISEQTVQKQTAPE